MSSAPILTAIWPWHPWDRWSPSAFTALIWLLSFRFAPSWKRVPLRGGKAYRVSTTRYDFATALQRLATCRDAYSPIVTRTPAWSPDDPQPPNSNAGTAPSKRSR